MGPGSFDIPREFDSINLQKTKEEKLDKNKEEGVDPSLNLSKTSAKKIKKIITPGPGLYNPEKIFAKIAIGLIYNNYYNKNYLNFLNSFKTAPRKDMSNPEKIPGPGAYTPEVYKISKCTKFQKSDNKESSYIQYSTQTPGPGNYVINDSFFKNNYSVKISLFFNKK